MAEWIEIYINHRQLAVELVSAYVAEWIEIQITRTISSLQFVSAYVALLMEKISEENAEFLLQDELKWIEERDNVVQKMAEEQSIKASIFTKISLTESRTFELIDIYYNNNLANQVINLLKKVLANQIAFYDVSTNEQVFLYDYVQKFLDISNNQSENFMSNVEFTALDMNGDSINEVILSLAGIYKIFHYRDGKIYAYTSDKSEISEIKKDGSYRWFDESSFYGYGKMDFSDMVLVTKTLAVCNLKGDFKYIVQDYEVTQAEFMAFSKVQKDKSDVFWREYTIENINNYLY